MGMSKAAEKFKTGKPGFGYKDGKLFRFEKKSVLVLAPWPNPQSWFKSHRKGWHSSRKRADRVFTDALYAKGDIDKNLLYFEIEDDANLRIWTGDPAVPDPEEVRQFNHYYGEGPRYAEDSHDCFSCVNALAYMLDLYKSTKTPQCKKKVQQQKKTSAAI
jgi:hypothetical protein